MHGNERRLRLYAERNNDNMPTEAELVRSAAKGDIEAFTDLISKYSNAAHAAAFHVVADYYDAQDIAQEAFVRAWMNLARLKDGEKFGSWLNAIVRRAAVDWLRKRGTKQTAFYVDLTEVRAEQSVEETVLFNERKQTVYSALARLSDPQRNVVLMYFIGGLNTREIGDFLGISNSTVESRLRRAKLKLKEEMLGMVEEVLSDQKVDRQFSQRVRAKIKALITIDIHVTDLKKSLHFYVDLLGFVLVRPPFHPDRNVEDNAIIRVEGGPNIILVAKPHTRSVGGSSIVFTYHTDDIGALHSLLQSHGVRVNERYDDGCGKWFECYDPDGNLVYVHAD